MKRWECPGSSWVPLLDPLLIKESKKHHSCGYGNTIYQQYSGRSRRKAQGTQSTLFLDLEACHQDISLHEEKQVEHLSVGHQITWSSVSAIAMKKK